MMSVSSSRFSLPILLLYALVTLAFAGLVALGVWQLQRLQWKEGLQAVYHHRLNLPAVPMLSVLRSADSVEDWQFRKVIVKGRFLHAQEVHYYLPSAPKIMEGVKKGTFPVFQEPGYLVFTPFQLENDTVLFVNRGFVPQTHKAADTRLAGLVTGEIEIIGRVRADDAPAAFMLPNDPVKNVWFVRNSAAFAAAQDFNSAVIQVLPFTLDLVPHLTASQEFVLPVAYGTVLQLQNNHLSYALTWFALAITLIVVFVIWRWRIGAGDRDHRSLS